MGDLLHQLRAVSIGVGAAMLAYVAWRLLGLVVRVLYAAAGRVMMPIESRCYQWLQDRATARTLGVDIDVIRMRRKVEFPRH